MGFPFPLTFSGGNISLTQTCFRDQGRVQLRLLKNERIACKAPGGACATERGPGHPLISDILLNRRQSLFGHIARLDSNVPANAALQLMVNSHEGKKPSTTWTRPSGRPRNTWLNHIQDADARPLSTIKEIRGC